MLSEHPVFVWQREKLTEVSSLDLSVGDAEKVLKYMYGANTEADYMSPEINPSRLVFGQEGFSHLTADMFLTNIIPATVEFPQLKGSEELIFSLLIQCAEGFTGFRRDKDSKLENSRNNRAAFHSIYGHRPAEELAALKDVIIVSMHSKDRVSELLGYEFKGTVTANMDYVNPHREAKVYIDTRYLVDNWNDMNKQQEFNHSVWAVMDYLHKSNDAQRFTMLIHSDKGCVSRLCAYN